MNILFVADVSMEEVSGGAERVLTEHASRLAKKGHGVYVITRRLAGHDSPQKTINGVQEFRYEISRSNSLAFLASSILNSRKIYSRLEKEIPFDIINFHQPFSALGIYSKIKNKPVKKVYSSLSLTFEEYETRNPRPASLSGRVLYGWNSRFRKLAEKWLISKCDRIIVLSEFSRDKLLEHYKAAPEKINVIPGGADLDLFAFAEHKDAARKELGLPADKIILLTVRNLVARMGLETLILALKEATRRRPDLLLLIGGEGPLRPALEGLIRRFELEDFIKLTGFIPHDRLPRTFQAADFFILPTKCLEGFGLVTVEAMACGTPVLGTPVGGTIEILRKFHPEFLFKDATPGSLAEGILSTVEYYRDKPDLARRLSRECRAYVEAHYSWETNCSLLEKLLTSMAEAGRTSGRKA